MTMNQDNLQLQVKSLPDKPGVYLFKNKDNKIIYVGKAKSLKKRVSSYFMKSDKDKKTDEIKKLSAKIETISTLTETEALVLENNLIKLHKPKLNIRLRDDKTYPYLYIAINEEYPRIEIIRNRSDKKGLYFGPFTDIKSLKLVLRKVLSIFPIASCRKDIVSVKFDRPCLYYQMKRCTAPCVGKIDKNTYYKNVQKIIKFFEGKFSELIEELKVEMDIAAERLDYEIAALTRDKIIALEKIMQKQTVYSNDVKAEFDIIGFAKKENISIIQILSMREGRIVNHNHFILDIPLDFEDTEVLSSFIKIHYSQSSFMPSKILIPFEIQDRMIINDWLREKRNMENNKEVIIKPQNEEHNNLLNLAKENAEVKLQSFLKAEEMKYQKNKTTLEELKQVLKLSKIPSIIEGYDISTIQGSNSVASCVVFENSRPRKSSYRKFIIKTVEGQDDFASMKEVIRRRFTGKLANKDPLPDLILIDGGLGQVNSAKSVLNEINLNIPLIGLAKEFEEIYFPGNSNPTVLNDRSEGLKLLQNIRDEAHRFAISFHRKKRSKNMLELSLEKIPGLGPKRIKNLLDHFGTIDEIKNTSIEKLVKCEGISRKIALEIYNFYKNSKI
ncbi:MAG: excinuclease ABC subunit UvrC [Candidatus Heimdallarchaeota archaeon]|nr:excinuclease ABC subunit UvrC [Candidatus Heimdallarchaeota archaeon]